MKLNSSLSKLSFLLFTLALAQEEQGGHIWPVTHSGQEAKPAMVLYSQRVDQFPRFPLLGKNFNRGVRAPEATRRQDNSVEFQFHPQQQFTNLAFPFGVYDPSRPQPQIDPNRQTPAIRNQVVVEPGQQVKLVVPGQSFQKVPDVLSELQRGLSEHVFLTSPNSNLPFGFSTVDIPYITSSIEGRPPSVFVAPASLPIPKGYTRVSIPVQGITFLRAVPTEAPLNGDGVRLVSASQNNQPLDNSIADDTFLEQIPVFDVVQDISGFNPSQGQAGVEAGQQRPTQQQKPQYVQFTLPQQFSPQQQQFPQEQQGPSQQQFLPQQQQIPAQQQQNPQQQQAPPQQFPTQQQQSPQQQQGPSQQQFLPQQQQFPAQQQQNPQQQQAPPQQFSSQQQQFPQQQQAPSQQTFLPQQQQFPTQQQQSPPQQQQAPQQQRPGVEQPQKPVSQPQRPFFPEEKNVEQEISVPSFLQPSQPQRPPFEPRPNSLQFERQPEQPQQQDRPVFGRPEEQQPQPQRPLFEKTQPQWQQPEQTPPERPIFGQTHPQRPLFEQPEPQRPLFEQPRPEQPRFEPSQPQRPLFEEDSPQRPDFKQLQPQRPFFDEPQPAFEQPQRPLFERPQPQRPLFEDLEPQRPNRPLFDDSQGQALEQSSVPQRPPIVIPQDQGTSSEQSGPEKSQQHQRPSFFPSESAASEAPTAPPQPSPSRPEFGQPWLKFDQEFLPTPTSQPPQTPFQKDLIAAFAPLIPEVNVEEEQNQVHKTAPTSPDKLPVEPEVHFDDYSTGQQELERPSESEEDIYDVNAEEVAPAWGQKINSQQNPHMLHNFAVIDSKRRPVVQQTSTEEEVSTENVNAPTNVHNGPKIVSNFNEFDQPREPLPENPDIYRQESFDQNEEYDIQSPIAKEEAIEEKVVDVPVVAATTTTTVAATAATTTIASTTTVTTTTAATTAATTTTTAPTTKATTTTERATTTTPTAIVYTLVEKEDDVTPRVTDAPVEEVKRPKIKKIIKRIRSTSTTTSTTEAPTTTAASQPIRKVTRKIIRRPMETTRSSVIVNTPEAEPILTPDTESLKNDVFEISEIIAETTTVASQPIRKVTRKIVRRPTETTRSSVVVNTPEAETILTPDSEPIKDGVFEVLETIAETTTEKVAVTTSDDLTTRGTRPIFRRTKPTRTSSAPVIVTETTTVSSSVRPGRPTRPTGDLFRRTKVTTKSPLADPASAESMENASGVKEEKLTFPKDQQLNNSEEKVSPPEKKRIKVAVRRRPLASSTENSIIAAGAVTSEEPSLLDTVHQMMQAKKDQQTDPVRDSQENASEPIHAAEELQADSSKNNVIGVSSATEVSLMYELCYRGRCVKVNQK